MYHRRLNPKRLANFLIRNQQANPQPQYIKSTQGGDFKVQISNSKSQIMKDMKYNRRDAEVAEGRRVVVVYFNE
jgi:hypothetical protein